MRWMLWGASAIAIAYGCVGTDPDTSNNEPGTDSGTTDTLVATDTAARPDDCSAIYVKAGAEGGTGCRDAPLGTITAALALARNEPARAQEIRICAGTYAESKLTLDVPISLLGGYDCTTWQTDAAYTYPALTTSTPTIVTNANFAADGTTLHVKGAAVGRAVVVRGLQIQGGPPNPAGPVDGASVAVRVDEGASPTIDSCRILGGAQTRAANFGSVGILAVAAGAPEIVHDVVDGGSGIVTNARYGSVGVCIDADGKAYVHDSKINGGRGTGDAAYIASVGLYFHMNTATSPGLTRAEGSALERNEISGGSGKASGTGSQVGSCAFYDEYGSVEAFDNSFDGGTGVAPTASGLPASLAIYVFQNRIKPAETTRFERNRILGGHKDPFAVDVLGDTGAVRLFDTWRVMFVNNLLVGGTGGTSGSAVYVSLAGDTDPLLVLRNNTVVAGQSLAVHLHTGADVENNVFITRGAESVFAMYGCPLFGDSIFRGNAFIHPNTILAAGANGCTAASTVAAFETEMKGAGVGTHLASNDVRYENDCGGETFPDGNGSGCITNTSCDAGAQCAGSLFDGFAFDTAPATGWPPKATGSCALVTGGEDLTKPSSWPILDGGVALPVVDKDLLSAMRTVPLSRGALEQNAAGCTNP